jgi:hypothetical protein
MAKLNRFSLTRRSPTLLDVGPQEFSDTGDVDLLIFALGYEERSTSVAKAIRINSRQALALRFSGPPIHAFEENENWAASAGVTVIQWEAENYKADLRKTIAEVCSGDTTHASPKIAIDISSMSRSMMAEVWAALLRARIAMHCIFLYSSARYDGAPLSFPPITINEPISSLFSAWPIEPQLPIELIVGLGYERGRAAAAIETFEATDITFFSPEGGDIEYASEIAEVNKTILRGSVGAPLVHYDVGNIFDTVARLSQFVSRSMSGSRSVIVPFGPKTFALAAMIAAISFPRRVSVWRMSGGTSDPTPNRISNGKISAVSVRLTPASAS